MKVLLINPEKLIHPPFGLLYIGSALKSKGHEVRLVEIPFDSTKEEYIALVESQVKDFEPRLVGVTCMSMQAVIARDVVRKIKEAFGDITVMVGGVHPTVDSHDALSWGADIAVRGEGERTVPEIIELCDGRLSAESIKGISYKRGNGFFDNPEREFIRNLDEIPPLSYDLLNKSRFGKRSYSIRGFWLRSAGIMTTRGCPGRCIFCASTKMHGLAVREFGIERMLDEIEGLKKDFGIEGLWVFDDTFTLKEKRVIEFCEGLRKRKIKVVWACQARVDTFNESMARAMKASGCAQVDFGVESGSQRVLDYINKHIKCDMTRRAFRVARESGLRALATVMVGLPTETEDDFLKTKELIEEIKPDFVVPSFTMPYPGTELYEMAITKGWIGASREIDWANSSEPMMASGMPASRIKKAFKELLSFNKSAFMDYLFQPGFLFDLSKAIVKNPKYAARIFSCGIRGRTKEITDLFLYIFRKEIINN